MRDFVFHIQSRQEYSRYCSGILWKGCVFIYFRAVHCEYLFNKSISIRSIGMIRPELNKLRCSTEKGLFSCILDCPIYERFYENFPTLGVLWYFRLLAALTLFKAIQKSASSRGDCLAIRCDISGPYVLLAHSIRESNLLFFCGIISTSIRNRLFWQYEYVGQFWEWFKLSGKFTRKNLKVNDHRLKPMDLWGCSNYDQTEVSA